VGQAKRFSKEVARGTKRARNVLQQLVLEGLQVISCAGLAKRDAGSPGPAASAHLGEPVFRAVHR
jgi:hypothetical protein